MGLSPCYYRGQFYVCGGGMLTKAACALWSAAAGKRPCAFAGVSNEVRLTSELCELAAIYNGPGVVAGYTVLFQDDAPWRAVAVFDLPGECRTVAYAEDAALVEQFMGEEQCGKSFMLSQGLFST